MGTRNREKGRYAVVWNGRRITIPRMLWLDATDIIDSIP
jgi:hypothetical protein